MKSDSHLVGLTTGGFGNRYNILLNSYNQAAYHNLDYSFIWQPANDCSVEYNDILCNNSRLIEEKKFKDIILQKNEVFFIASGDHGNWLYSQIKKIFSNIEVIRINANDIPVIKEKKIAPYFISSLISPCDNYHSAIETFKINEDIIAKASAFVKEYKIDKTVEGLMIRKTDACFFKGRETDESKYYNYILNNTHRSFFVMSDDNNVIKLFSDLPNVIISADQPNISLNYADKNIYRNKESVINGLINVLILSKTNINFTTTNSTFLDVARYYVNVNF